MSKRLKIGVGAFIILFVGYWIINNFVYPFFPDSPNYSDVERVFNRMQFPAEWEEIDSSENKGLHGRSCPIEPGSRCFHKSITFSVPHTTGPKDVESVLKLSGCQTIAKIDNTPKGNEEKEYRFKCSADGLDIGADLDEGKDEVYISVAS